MKRVISLLLVLVMLCSTFAGLQITSHALSNSGSCGDNVNYTFDSNTGLVSIYGTGEMSFFDRNSSPFSTSIVKTVEIKEGVKSIGANAFYNCTALSSISIPKSVKRIGINAFTGCNALRNVYIDSIESWCNISFYSITSNPISFAHKLYVNNSLLTELEINDSIKSILDFAFYGCNSLTSITLPDSVTTIGREAFSGCAGLTDVYFSDSVTTMGYNAFYNTAYYNDSNNWEGGILYCNEVLVNAKNDSILGNVAVKEGTKFIANGAFIDCTSMIGIEIPSSVTSIGESTFSGCTGLISITIPDSVSSINSSVFYNCSGLKELTLSCSAKIYNSENTFKNCANIEKVTLTKGTGTMQSFASSTGKAETYYQYTPWYISRENIKELVVEEGVSNIPNYAFYNCVGLNDITLPESVTSIGDNTTFNGTAYYNNAKNWENGVLYIDTALIRAKSDTVSGQFEVKSGTICIADYAFSNCNGLTSLILPDSVSSVGNSAFLNCNNLKTAKLGAGIETIEKSSFDSLTTITLPVDKNIDFTCFENCTDLHIINLTSGNGQMLDWSSNYADSLWYLHKDTIREVNLEEGIENISESAFNGCVNLVKTNVPFTVKSIGRYAYAGCSNLRNITIESPDCIIPVNENTIDSYATIYGYDNSTAKDYADQYNRAFVSIGDYYNCAEHTIVIDKAVASSCTETGLSEGAHCSVCRRILIAQETAPATGHFYTNSITAPTATTLGYTRHTCSSCDDSFDDSFTAPVGKITLNFESKTETYVSLVWDAIDTATGYQVQISDYVGTGWDVYQNVDNSEATFSNLARNHEYKFRVRFYIKGPDGKNYFSPWSATANISTNDHAYQTEVMAPTCTTPGHTSFVCSTCGYSYEGDYVEALGHKTAPAVKENEVEATCTKDGSYEAVITCSVCGIEISRAIFTEPALGHIYESEITKQPSCNAAGEKVSTCTRCHIKVAEEIARVAHSYQTKMVEATCVSSGFTVYTCSVCGDSFRADYVSALEEHNYKGIVSKPADCMQRGTKIFTCTICGDKYTETIPMTDHTVVSDSAVAPTCTKYGLSAGEYCAVCGKVFELQEKLEPLGHDFGSVVTPATLTANGVIKHPCSRCDKAAANEVIYAPKTFTLAKTSYVYTGKAIASAVTVKDSKGNVLKKGSDYTIAYQANKAIGTAKAVITFKGNYKGTKTLAFTIVPKTTNLALAGAKKTFIAKWIKLAGVTGYQVQYASNAKFTGAKAVNVKGASKAAQAVKNLKGGAKYYVRIRTYKTVGGKNYFSTWSAAKAVTTKK